MGEAVTAVRSFSDFFPYEDFRKLLDLDIARENGGEADQKAYSAHLKATYEKAFMAYLKTLKEDGVLRPIPGSGGRAGNFMLSWNAMATDDPMFVEYPDGAWYRIEEKFSFTFINLPMMLAGMKITKGGNADEIARETYDRLVADITEGKLDARAGHEGDYCHITGERLYIELDGWTPRLLKRKEDRSFEEITDLVRDPIKAIEVEFKTGDLLITDWFDIPEVTARREGIKRIDVNSTVGRERAVEWLAREQGILSVYTGNVAPEVYSRDGALVFGWSETAITGPTKYHGRISNDVSLATIIERQRLVEIVAESRGWDEAERVVADYLNEHRRDIVEVKVEPGVHHFYFSGDHEDFTAAFRSPDLQIDRNLQPYFVMSDRPLTLDTVAEHNAELPRP